MASPAGNPYGQASPLPRVDIQRDNGRVVAIYLDQFLIRGVRAISFEEAVGRAPLLKLEIVIDDIVVRDGGTNPAAGDEGALAVSVPEGGTLIGSEVTHVVRADTGPLMQGLRRARQAYARTRAGARTRA